MKVFQFNPEWLSQLSKCLSYINIFLCNPLKCALVKLKCMFAPNTCMYHVRTENFFFINTSHILEIGWHRNESFPALRSKAIKSNMTISCLLRAALNHEESPLELGFWLFIADARNTRVKTDRPTGRQTDSQTDRQTDRQTNRQTDRQADKQWDDQ